ncbi:MAG: bactofilin family protein [Dissulfurispiraceae bacterium]
MGALMRLLTFVKEAIKDLLRRTDRFEVLIGAGSESKGNIRAAGTVKIEGRHRGNVAADFIVILEKAYVRGDMHTRTAIIGGAVEGNISADGLVEIKGTGRLDGAIYSRRLTVAEGGIFNGDAHLNKSTAELPVFVKGEEVAT